MLTRRLVTYLLFAILASGCASEASARDQYCGKAAGHVRDLLDGDWRDAFEACKRDPNEPWNR